METAGQWLEKALVELCAKIETGLGLGLDEEIIKGLVSYCDLAQPRDAKEYLDNIIGQEVGKSVIEEYLRRRGHSEFSTKSNVPTTTLHAYVKPPSVETSTSGSKKRTPKTVTVRGDHAEPNKIAVGSSQGSEIPATSSESRTSHKVNQVSSKKKKAGKTISLAEAAKGSIVFQQGRPCACQARRHNLVSNCLSCGKIVCEQEGEGPCNFCGALVLKEGSSYAGLEESLPPLSETEAAAEAYAKRLVDYDRNAAARTTVIDDQSDYYELDSNTWLSKEEKDLLKKKQEEMEEAERAKRNKVVVTFDLVGRKVLLNQDEVSESQPDNRILRAPDVREVNRIIPNPTLKIQPVFVDLGFSKKSANDRQASKGKQSNKGLSKGLCLEITGRVQHDSKDLKFLQQSQFATDSNGKIWQGPSGNGELHVEDDGECLLDI
ncbi:putative Zinc finger, C2HC5-type [Medicago truncatula]|uniref:Putative Zinc finger, C2HC5-type n=1 Tax=Medicago truncatula TaxID=3880 RepID=G7JQZ7_MEDTR|nr:activating signal cointegrator 1 [Medicago truncatula]AES91264.2 transcription regulator/zinc ion-binding protein [Medicago truncatula]RHN63655.1 putative Zinc finger, C2HC5-type [Medicago truncatula]